MRRRWPALWAMLAAVPAQAQSPADQSSDQDVLPRSVIEAWRPPTLTITRYTEDWSALADPAKRTGRWTAPFKYIPLGEADRWLSSGLELRARVESGQGQTASYWRAMPHADLHWGRLRAFVQGLANTAGGVAGGPAPVDRTGIDLLQAFVDYTVPLGTQASLRLEGGRQLVSLGSERLVGTRYGPNTPQPFDGTRALLDAGPYTASVFYLVPVVAGPRRLDDRRSRQKALWGLYATRWLGAGQKARIDAYAMAYHDRAASLQQAGLAGGTGEERRTTLGLRAAGQAGRLYWDGEAMVQRGHLAGRAIRAWSVALRAGRRFPALPMQPDLSVHADLASGDRAPGDGRVQGFNPLFPKGKYFGELSPFGPRNLIDVHPALVLSPLAGVKLGLSAMAYWRHSRGDGIYDVPGRQLHAADAGQGRFLGKQVEAVLSWQATPELTLTTSASHFVPGAFLVQAGAARPIDLFAGEAVFRF
ncbi:alginate export family protein [Novosphingobium rhizosphaerae]|uniref:alginate export family protein n=1 Tax=Novosphingobium rhizosphaerae TaxID=1551649 RepID=UPI003D814F99